MRDVIIPDAIRRLFFRLDWQPRGRAELATRNGVTWIIQPYRNGVVDGYTWIAFSGMPPVKIAQSDSLYFDKAKVKRVVRETALRVEAER